MAQTFILVRSKFFNISIDKEKKKGHNSDDAFEVIEIREYIESLENSEEHTNIK